MMNPEAMYALTKGVAEDRHRRADQARTARQARLASGRESTLRRWLQSLARARPAVPDLPVGDPQPEVPVEDPWSEAA
ncbi:MAG TPA: hypothetical protein VIV08_02775 [Acidimicrobiia bacterium]